MSMNAEPENFDQNFDQLCRALKLKRHELPPPRYFNEFSTQVITRIRAGEPAGRWESLETNVSQSPWMQRFWRAIEQRPAVAGLLTAGACALLVVGIFMSDGERPTLSITADGMAKIETPELGQAGQNSFAAAGIAPGGLLFENSSTNPAIQMSPGPSLFNEFPQLGAPQRVNGMPIGLR